MANVGIMGAGGWALGLAMTLNRNNHKVTVWSKVKAELDAIRETGQNERSLPGVMIPKEIVLSEDLKALAENNDILIMAVASPYVRSTAKELSLTGVKNLKIVNVAKGIEEGTLRTMTQIIEEEIPDCKTAVLSGPSQQSYSQESLPLLSVSWFLRFPLLCLLQH